MKINFKNKFFGIFLTLLLSLGLSSQALASGSWVNVGTVGFSSGSVGIISLDINSTDVEYVAFVDGANSDKATVMKYNGSAWELVGSAGFSAGSIEGIFLSIDSNDIPYVVYEDGANSDKATVMKYNGSAWELVGSAGFSTDYVQLPKLKFNSTNQPYIFFTDENSKATVMKYNGSAWELVGSAGFSAGIIDFRSTYMVLDSNDTPYVSFSDNANSDKATVMKYNGSAWELVGGAGFSSDYIYRYTSIVVDSNDIPYIAFADGDNSENPTVMKYNGSAWELVGSAGFSTDGATYISLVIDSNDTLYIGFQDFAGYSGIYSKATVMKYNGSAWELVGSAGFSADSITYTSLALDSNNAPYIAYQDNSVSSKATVMRYASSLKAINSFTISGQGSVNESSKTVTVNLACGVNLSSLTPTISISSLASTSPLSGVAQDFTSPVTYTLTADDNTTQDYSVTVNSSTCTSSGTSAGSRASNLIAMGKVTQAQEILNQFPNAINELQGNTTPIVAPMQPVIKTFTFKNNVKLSWAENFNNPDVHTLQEFLNTQGYNLKIDGKFGPLTHYAVKAFQLKNNLSSDGIVGPITRGVINGFVQ